ncbi:MAG: DUF3536 domain-containing protein [Anaerolineae bacterium]|jgi:hypothetical protein|nr:DUF3536 domain-containing protein [Anaerolineae bacterium]
MTLRACCIHGHFYQPPREDPITGEIPPEPGAAPHKNWNERIFYQSYKPNAELGNFSRISYNLGPTLADWLEQYDPKILAMIIEQGSRNYIEHGVGNAMAQAYHHTILPLATREDKETQIRWGIADFEHRYGHKPSGFWLPETAVDLETLEILALCGIQFTILAPWQAESEDLDVTQPYWVKLPGDQSIAVFFYQMELSGMVSFQPNKTQNADEFVTQEILPRYADQNDHDQLIMIASDGELYGHHQPFRDKFLQFLTSSALENHNVNLTYPGLWLKNHPPKSEIRIRENTSWSCFHGVTRWSGVCACALHGEWKAPLRQGLDRIAKLVDDQYLDFARRHVPDPWKLRHNYLSVHLRLATVEELLYAEVDHPLSREQIRTFALLLAAQYERQRIYTSCGWFFDDFDRIEPRNIIAYAAQAVWLTWLATGVNLKQHAEEALRHVQSWRSGLRADTVFDHQLERARLVHEQSKLDGS